MHQMITPRRFPTRHPTGRARPGPPGEPPKPAPTPPQPWRRWLLPAAIAMMLLFVLLSRNPSGAGTRYSYVGSGDVPCG